MTAPGGRPDAVDNRLMLNCYFIDSACSTDSRRHDFADRSIDGGREREKSHAFFAGAAQKCGSPRSALLYFEINDQTGPAAGATAASSFEPNALRRH
jgi:hypothetical protein